SRVHLASARRLFRESRSVFPFVCFCLQFLGWGFSRFARAADVATLDRRRLGPRNPASVGSGDANAAARLDPVCANCVGRAPDLRMDARRCSGGPSSTSGEIEIFESVVFLGARAYLFRYLVDVRF